MASTSPKPSLDKEMVVEGWTKVDWTRVNLGSFWLRGGNDA
jgi:hypothetical protein